MFSNFEFTKSLSGHNSRAALATFFLLLLLLPAAPVLAATINVDSDCSLANAIRSANGDAQVAPLNSCEAGAAGSGASGADTITIADATLTVSALLPEITSQVTINSGHSGGHTRIFAGASVTGPLLASAEGSQLTLENLELFGGGSQSPGKAQVELGDSATLTNVSLLSPRVTALRGNKSGATFTLTNIFIAAMSASSGSQWPALYADKGTWVINQLGTISITGGKSLIHTSQGASVTISGCVTIRRDILPPKTSGDGSFTDNSTGACATGTVFGAASTISALTLPTMGACGMPLDVPSGGWLQAPADGSRLVYTLTADCDLSKSPIYVPHDVKVTIRSDSNGPHTITGAPFVHINHPAFQVYGELRLEDVEVNWKCASGLLCYALTAFGPKAKMHFEDTVFRPPPSTPAAHNMLGLRLDNVNQAILDGVTIEKTKRSAAVAASAIRVMGSSRVDICDSTFNNNKGGHGAIEVQQGALVRLSCANTWSNNTPANIYDPHGRVTRFDDTDWDPHYWNPQDPAAQDPAVQDPAAQGGGAQGGVAPVAAGPPVLQTTCDTQPANIMVADRHPNTQCQRVSGAGIGVAALVEGGAREAVDVWNVVTPGTKVCFATTAGSIQFLDAAGVPRQEAAQAAFREGDMLCTRIGGAGTVVLMPGPVVAEPAAAAVEEEGPTLANCMVRTTHILNMRESPGGAVLGLIPFDVTLTAFERSDGWYKVDYHGARGWISSGHVVPKGNCG